MGTAFAPSSRMIPGRVGSGSYTPVRAVGIRRPPVRLVPDAEPRFVRGLSDGREVEGISEYGGFAKEAPLVWSRPNGSRPRSGDNEPPSMVKTSYAEKIENGIGHGPQDPKVYRLPGGGDNGELELKVHGTVSNSEERVSVSMLIDTGSMVSLVGRRVAENWPRWGEKSRVSLRLADGTSVLVSREGKLKLGFPGLQMEHLFVEADLEEEVILGMDFLEKTSAVVDLKKRRMRLEEYDVELDLSGRSSSGGKSQQLKVVSVNEKRGLSSSVDVISKIKHEFPSIFGKTDGEFGRTAWVKHKIHTGDAWPIKQRPRRLPAQLWDTAKSEIEKMVKMGVIEKSESPWCSPVVLVKKKDGETRFCVDYRKLNEVTKKDSYPLPNLTEMLSCLGGAKWFSVLDLRSGYWQIEMEKTDKEKTAFSIGTGLWQFTVMPFGLSNAVATFQRLMERVLGDLIPRCCMVYVDDIIIYGRTENEGLENLRMVIERLTRAGLTLSEKKCKILQKEVKFLGHVITSAGISMDADKIKSVKEWPIPKCVKELRGFLGLATYYRKFVAGFAEIAEPLNRMLQKEESFEMGVDQIGAMNRLISALTTGPVLKQPDFSKTFILDTDASDVGIGAVLQQVGSSGENVVAYYSKGLSKAERNYCTTRKELLALVKAVKHFRQYLLGKEFVVRTDHSALQWLRNFKEPEGQVARWLEFLQEYDFVVRHRKGSSHSNADSLSRRPCVENACLYCEKKEMQWKSRQVVLERDWVSDQEADQDLNLIRSKLAEYPTRPSAMEMGTMSKCVLLLWKQWDSLVLREGVLMRKRERSRRENFQLVVPRRRRIEVLEEIHAGRTSGHFGVERTFRSLQENFYWPGYHRSVEVFCAGCVPCLRRNDPGKISVPPLGLRTVGFPFERIAIDIMGPLRISDRGNRYVLVVGDYFTKWIEAYALPNQEALTIATTLCEEFFCRFGIPNELHSDQGRNFESAIVKELCDLLGIKKTRTTPFRPQSDGMIERFNRTLGQMLSKVVDLDQRNWDVKLPYAMLAYRASSHSVTGFPPAEMLLGLKLRLPVDLLIPKEGRSDKMYGEFVREHQVILEELRDRVCWGLREVGQKMKARFDQKACLLELKEGDQVWMRSLARTKGLSPKLQSHWDGPFTVVSVINEQLVKIRKGRRVIVVHRSKVKKVMGNTELARMSVGDADSEETDDCRE